MTHRVYFLNTLHETTDPAAYEEWIRTGDYPPARANPAIVSYDVTRIEATLDGTGTPSIHYLEVLDVTDMETYREALATPTFEKLLAEWSMFVASAEAIHGTVIEQLRTRDEDEQRWVSDAEIAFTASSGRRKAEHITARLIVRRR